MSYSNESDSRTLTAGAGAVTVLSLGQGAFSVSSQNDQALPVHVALRATNTSAVLSASMTATLQMNTGGGWSDVASVTLDLGVLGGVTGSKFAPLIAMAAENSGASTIDVRLRASCTGANVTLDSNWIVRDADTPR